MSNTVETVSEALQIAGEGNGWTVRQVNFIMGTRSIQVSSWDKSMVQLGQEHGAAGSIQGHRGGQA